MQNSSSPPKPPQGSGVAREERLRHELRQNLKKRKAQARAQDGLKNTNG